MIKVDIITLIGYLSVILMIDRIMYLYKCLREKNFFLKRVIINKNIMIKMRDSITVEVEGESYCGRRKEFFKRLLGKKNVIITIYGNKGEKNKYYLVDKIISVEYM